MKFKDLIIQIIIGFFVMIIIILLIVIILIRMQTAYNLLPPPNSTQEWKEILSNDDPCGWYDFGCQRLECVIDCTEINKHAGEIICVC